MPTLSYFYGIYILMYWDDHPPPHFHAAYAGDGAVVDIQKLEIIRGSLPGRARLLVLQWAKEHQAELLEAWEECSNQRPPRSIAPLE
jgi:hypothetical protein